MVGKGFMQSFRPIEAGFPAIQLDTAYTAFFRSGPLVVSARWGLQLTHRTSSLRFLVAEVVVAAAVVEVVVVALLVAAAVALLRLGVVVLHSLSSLLVMFSS